MSPVDFKKWPCRPVGFKGQGPPYSNINELLFCSEYHVNPSRFVCYYSSCISCRVVYSGDHRPLKVLVLRSYTQEDGCDYYGALEGGS